MNEVIERCNSAVSDISQGPLAVEIGEPMAHLEVLADAACLVVPTSEPGGPAAALGAAMVPPHYCPASWAGPSAMVTEIKPFVARDGSYDRSHPNERAPCASFPYGPMLRGCPLQLNGLDAAPAPEPHTPATTCGDVHPHRMSMHDARNIINHKTPCTALLRLTLIYSLYSLKPYPLRFTVKALLKYMCTLNVLLLY